MDKNESLKAKQVRLLRELALTTGIDITKKMMIKI